MTHAQLSPSSAHRWLNCPASVELEAKYPNQTSEYAAEGTAAHFLASECLEKNYKAEQYGFNRWIIVKADGNCYSEFGDQISCEDTDFAFKVTQDMAENVQSYVGFVRNLSEQTHGTLLVEQKLPISQLTGEDGATGTADTVILTDDEIIIVDLKYGQGVTVNAEDNEQLHMYALGAFEEYQLLGNFKRVRLIIHQPRKNNISESVVELEQLTAFAARVKVQAQKINSGQTYFQPSNTACKFCKAKGDCKALAQHCIDSVVGDFVDLDDPELTNTLQHAGEQAQSDILSNTQLGKLLSQADLISDWLKAISANAHAKIENGESVHGWKLVQGRAGARRWVDDSEAETTLKAMRLKVDDMYTKKLISPTNAEKLNKSGTLGNKQWAKLQDIITKPEGNPTLAPEGDKRQALIFNPADDFVDLPDEAEAFNPTTTANPSTEQATAAPAEIV